MTDPAAATSAEPALATVRYSPDGNVIAAGGQDANHVTLWDAASGRVIGAADHDQSSGRRRAVDLLQPGFEADRRAGRSRDCRDLGGRHGPPGRIATGDRERERGRGDLRHGGRTLIASDDSGSVSMVDIRTGRPIRPRALGRHRACRLAGPQSGWTASGRGSYEGPVFVWDTKTGTPYGSPLAADTSPGNDVEFSPDGRTLVSSDQRSAVVWNMNGEQAIGKAAGRRRPIRPPTWLSAPTAGGSPPGGSTAARRCTTRRRDGRRSGSTALRSSPRSPSTPMGSTSPSATIDGKVRLFDAQSGAVVGRPLDVGQGAVWQIAFSPDGRLLAVAVDPNGEDGFNVQQRQGEVQLWDVDTRSRVGRAIAPGAGSVLSWPSTRTGRCWRPAATAAGSTCGMWPARNVTASRCGWSTTPSRASRSIRAAGSSPAAERTDRCACGAWRISGRPFRPSPGTPAPITGAAFDPADSFLATTTCSARPGCGIRPPVSATATSWSRARGPARSRRPSSFQFLGLRNAFSPDGKVLAVAESRPVRCCGTSTRPSGAGVPARSRAET